MMPWSCVDEHMEANRWGSSSADSCILQDECCRYDRDAPVVVRPYLRVLRLEVVFGQVMQIQNDVYNKTPNYIL